MAMEKGKKVVNAIIFVLIMAFLALSASALNDGISSDSSLKTAEKMPILENQNLERYTWFNGDREEHIYSAIDEVGIFDKKDSKTNNIQEIAQGYDPQATLIKDYEYVTLLNVPRQLNNNTMEEKNSKFRNETGNNVNLVFYGDQKKDQAPMVLTGEIIVHFRQDWDENRITNWANDRGIEIIKNFPISPNTYLFRAGSGLRSLELANQIYLSGDVIYAYPNWWKAMNTKAIPDDPLFSDQWHLRNTGQGGGTAGEDVNITLVWDVYRGSENEVIAIVDDGLEILQPDLAPNILPGYSWDYVERDTDPTGGCHGTSVAGVAAARGWNALGVTGAAPYSRLIGYRFGYTNASNCDDLTLSYELSDSADALTKNMQIVDIYSNSWGPAGLSLDGPSPLE
ncbi:MAG: S8 family serine peptidase, partial [Candidatus Methanoperedens sp.]|nr:S8 family serine peptidase [Candidatus Methanoperedens sp.]